MRDEVSREGIFVNEPVGQESIEDGERAVDSESIESCERAEISESTGMLE